MVSDNDMVSMVNRMFVSIVDRAHYNRAHAMVREEIQIAVEQLSLKELVVLKERMIDLGLLKTERGETDVENGTAVGEGISDPA